MLTYRLSVRDGGRTGLRQDVGVQAHEELLGEFRDRLAGLGWVTDVLVGGSAATGDYRPGVSDLDLVAVVEGGPDGDRRRAIARLHRDLDATSGRGMNLGCVYVAAGLLALPEVRHPTWTHGRLIDRPLSRIARAELVEHGFALHGRPPAALLPAMDADDVRAAVRSELDGYWSDAVRHPWWLLDTDLAELAIVTMARARHALATGQLITKTAAIARLDVPAALASEVRMRREGARVTSPRLRTAYAAWRAVRDTVAASRT